VQQEEISIRRKLMPEEEEVMDPETAQILKVYLENIASGICPHCKAKIEDKKQSGRCVYALPCWHRLYQGTLPAKQPKIHPYLQGKDTWDE
jgi:hypothetical protein